MSVFDEQFAKVKNDPGFIAALDQSGGSTPKALRLYGILEDQYDGEAEMFDKVHEMRTRIMTNEHFNGEKILGAILFEMTMDREVEGKPTAQYLWEEKHIVPFLKVDKGLEEEANGVQLMKPMPDIDKLLERAKEKGIFGTKMRSVIHSADEAGISEIVDQQFEIGKQIIAHGLVPIIEPEVDIHSATKEEAETILKLDLMAALDDLEADQKVMLKLTLPEQKNLYKECVDHPNVLRVVALSGGYSREEANDRLGENNGMVASFSRALTEGLSVDQSDEEFSETLGASIDAIFKASNT